MIQAKVRGGGFKPAARGGVFDQIKEVLVGLEEHGLGNVLRVGLITQNPAGSRKHHVLVLRHEQRKLICIRHFCPNPFEHPILTDTAEEQKVAAKMGLNSDNLQASDLVQTGDYYAFTVNDYLLLRQRFHGARQGLAAVARTKAGRYIH